MRTTSAAPPPELLELPTFLISKIHSTARRMMADALGSVGLRLQHYRAISTLAAFGPASQRDLSGWLEIDPAEVVRLVDFLESHGLATRRTDPSDRRRQIIELTQAGLKARDQCHELAAKVQDDLLHALNPQDRETLRALLTRVYETRPSLTG